MLSCWVRGRKRKSESVESWLLSEKEGEVGVFYYILL